MYGARHSGEMLCDKRIKKNYFNGLKIYFLYFDTEILFIPEFGIVNISFHLKKKKNPPTLPLNTSQ